MSNKYYSILTKTGQAQFTNTAALGSKLKLQTIKIGDGGDDNGKETSPKESDTQLIRERWSGHINDLYVNPENQNWLVIEATIPDDDGGFYITEFGVYDDQNNLIAIGKYPKTYKPNITEGSGSSLFIRVMLQVSNANQVDMKVDPAIMLASKRYVGDKFKEHQNSTNPHEQYELKINLQDAAYKSILEITDNILPVGTPIPWPSNILPDGWGFMEGQKFDLDAFPRLAKIYPSGVIPDLRGLVIKGRKNERELLSFESDQVKSHTHTGSVHATDLGTKNTNTTGAHTHSTTAYHAESNDRPGLAGAGGNITAYPNTASAGNHSHSLHIGAHKHSLTINEFGESENTVKNIAFNYIVRMA
ncbi:phage tail protein [Spartinivicinus poritis]|uniref:Phage tail protein n=1 Tax=Spartinivicinus poritis TaxID=2994640 RepID=A0ABT5UBL0_9GAMM|nr:phage tail protein [Spartinivicinus sp. A2-2]MDE1463366.1 phage tail protein [Spartinivicinus sp. A2-2]